MNNITISFKNLKHTDSLDQRIKEKTQKLDKFFCGKTKVKWHCYVEDGFHISEASIIGPTFDFHAKGKSDNLYKTFDQVCTKLEKQLSKKQAKFKDKQIKQKNFKDPSMKILDPEQAWGEYDEDLFDDVG